jgi:hypothetical protein
MRKEGRKEGRMKETKKAEEEKKCMNRYIIQHTKLLFDHSL